MAGDLTGMVSRVLGRVFTQRAWPSNYVPKRILVIKPCCLGDVLMATPTLAVLRHAFLGARIEMMVGTWSRVVVENNPNIDEIVDCGDLGSGRHYGMGDYCRLVREIRERHYDCCFVLERSPLLSVMPWLAGIPVRVGLDSAGRGFSLTVRVPCPERRHEAELYLDTVRAVGIEPYLPHLEFWPTEDERKAAEKVLPSEGRPLVALHPGGGVNPGMSLVSKRWPADRFGMLADRLIAAGFRVLLVGSAADRAVADRMKEGAKHGNDIVDLVGRLNLGELGALFEQCRLVIANDTGPMHLAVGVGTTVVAIFGPTDPLVYGPYRRENAVAHREMSCSPCFKKGHAGDCQEPRCMTDLTVDEVWRLIEAGLRQSESAFKR